MASPKLEKALYGPSTAEVILGAFLGLLVGVVVACVYLVFKPVITVQEIPKEPVRGMVYYLPGAEGKAKSKEWDTKLKQFISGGSIQLNTEELNAWIAAQKNGALVKPAAAPAAPGAAVTTPPPVEGYVIPGTPNIRLINEQMQVGLRCTLNWYGLATDVTVQATGTFQKFGDRYEFRPKTFYLGSCPLHILPGIGGLLLNHIVEKQKFSDELHATWVKLGGVSIAGSTLSLSAP